MKQLENNIGRTSTFLSSIWGVLTIAGTIVAGTIGGYWWLQDSVVERNAKIISSTAIDQLKEEIDPLSSAEYREDRRRDSIQRINAELLAIDYMNRTDSVLMVIENSGKHLKHLSSQLARLEAKIDAREMPNDDDQLARIWEFLKAREKSDSTALQLQIMMDEIRRMNQEKIRSIKSGDRAQ